MSSPRRSRARGSNAEWRALARQEDVLFNILAVPGKEGSWTADDFYATGLKDWSRFRHHWLHYAGELAGTCAEIGCGAGRMTRALATDFDRVIGVDVSEDMLARARQVVPDNVEFQLVDAPRLPFEDGSVDALFSVHVLQHIDSPDDVRSYLAEARRVLRPGGTMMVHIPLEGHPLSLRRRARMELGLWRSRRALRRGEPHSLVRMRLYPVHRVKRLLFDLGFEEIELRSFSPDWSGYSHDFWFTRAP